MRRSTTSRSRQAGASARERLKMAAALQWKVPVAEVEAHRSALTHTPTKRSLRYGEVAAAAAAVKLPKEPEVGLYSDVELLKGGGEAALALSEERAGRGTKRSPR